MKKAKNQAICLKFNKLPAAQGHTGNVEFFNGNNLDFLSAISIRPISYGILAINENIKERGAMAMKSRRACVGPGGEFLAFLLTFFAM